MNSSADAMFSIEKHVFMISIASWDFPNALRSGSIVSVRDIAYGELSHQESDKADFEILGPDITLTIYHARFKWGYLNYTTEDNLTLKFKIYILKQNNDKLSFYNLTSYCKALIYSKKLSGIHNSWV